MPYPYPNATSYGVFEFWQYIASVEPKFGMVMLLIIWSVLFIATLRFNAFTAWIFASFVTMIIAGMMVLMGFATIGTLVICIILLAIGIFAKYLADSPD